MQPLPALTGAGAATLDASQWLRIGQQHYLRTVFVQPVCPAVAANAEMNVWLQSKSANAGSVAAIGATGDGSLAVFTD